MKPKPYTLELGIKIARYFEKRIIPMGWHCALGGSVLHKGESCKDVDIFVYRHNDTDRSKGCTTMAQLADMLQLALGTKCVVLCWFKNHPNYPNDKTLIKIDLKGVYVDVFFMDCFSIEEGLTYRNKPSASDDFLDEDIPF